MKSVVRLASIGLAALALAGCSASPGDGNGDSIPRADLTDLLTEAQASGASEHQLAVMQRAHRSGSMTYADLDELVPDLLVCLEAAGFTTIDTGTVEYYPGYPVPAYGSTAPSNLSQEQASDVESECANETYDWAQIYYVSQGAAVDAYVQSFMDQRPAILSCLREHGVTVDDDVPADELIYLVTEDSQAGGNEVCYTGDIFIGYSRP